MQCMSWNANVQRQKAKKKVKEQKEKIEYFKDKDPKDKHGISPNIKLNLTKPFPLPRDIQGCYLWYIPKYAIWMQPIF